MTSRLFPELQIHYLSAEDQETLIKTVTSSEYHKALLVKGADPYQLTVIKSYQVQGYQCMTLQASYILDSIKDRTTFDLLYPYDRDLTNPLRDVANYQELFTDFVNYYFREYAPECHYVLDLLTHQYHHIRTGNYLTISLEIRY